jgi:hypothetical protein
MSAKQDLMAKANQYSKGYGDISDLVLGLLAEIRSGRKKLAKQRKLAAAGEGTAAAAAAAAVTASPPIALTDIHMRAYAAHIRTHRGPGPTNADLALAANEAGLKAVWDAATAIPRAQTADEAAFPEAVGPNTAATPKFLEVCDRGVCASFLGHPRSCAEASGWSPRPSNFPRRR